MENIDIKKIALAVLAVLVVVAAGFAVYFRWQVADLRAHPDKITKEEVSSVVNRVSQIMVLPNEQPTVATVADPSKLKDQSFFSQAKVGDKLLIYPNARKAILYDPVNNKILESAPLLIGNTVQK